MKALIFDVDGTLADTEREGHRIAFNRAFREFGFDWDWGPELYGELLGITGGKERIHYYLDQYHPKRPTERQVRESVNLLHACKTRHYTELLRTGGIPLRPGVKRLLLQARACGLKLAIATTTTPENVTALLETSLCPSAVSWFDVICAGDCVPAKKPAPDIYLMALEQLGVTADECFAFEDSANGLQSALGAGIPTIVTVNDYTRDQDFTGALTVLTDLGDTGQPARCLQGLESDVEAIDVPQLRRWHRLHSLTPALLQKKPA